MAHPIHRQNNGSSIAATGNRMSAGSGGIYRKTESKVLLIPDAEFPGGTPGGIATNLRATIECPSSRIRVAFGVSGKSNYLPNENVAGDSSSGDMGSRTTWNALPYMRVKGSYISANQGADQSEFLAGRPIFWMYPPGFGTLTQPEVAAPYFEVQGPSAAHVVPGPQYSGGFIPHNVLTTYQVGRLVPDAYEALSASHRYEIYVWHMTTGNDVAVQVWADWEIIDPRDGEDTEALLTACTLYAPPTVHV